jgi:hypothetical protein
MCHAENLVITPNKANDISLPATEVSINCNPYQNEEVRVRVWVGGGYDLSSFERQADPMLRRQSS